MPTESERRWMGLRLRHIRELADVSRERMAHALGVTPGAVGHWESGRSVPNGRQLAIWARETGISIELLYRETGLLDDEAGPEPDPNKTLRGWWRARSAPHADSTPSAGVYSAATATSGGTSARPRRAIAPGNPPLRRPLLAVLRRRGARAA